LQRQIATLLPQCILGDIGNDHLSAEKYGGRARAETRAYGRAFHPGAELSR
jgi:hypothetical protein